MNEFEQILEKLQKYNYKYFLEEEKKKICKDEKSPWLFFPKVYDYPSNYASKGSPIVPGKYRFGSRAYKDLKPTQICVRVDVILDRLNSCLMPIIDILEDGRLIDGHHNMVAFRLLMGTILPVPVRIFIPDV